MTTTTTEALAQALETISQAYWDGDDYRQFAHDALAAYRSQPQDADMARDAARYRWWRDSPDSPIANEPRATDAWVDAAMAGTKP